MAVSVERRKFLDVAIRKLSDAIDRENEDGPIYLSGMYIEHIAEYELDYLANSSPRYYANTERLLREKPLTYILDVITPRVLSSDFLGLEIDICFNYEEGCGGCADCDASATFYRKEVQKEMRNKMLQRKRQTITESQESAVDAQHQLTLQGV